LPYTTLISTTGLSAGLTDPDWLVVDCRFELTDRKAGARAWQAGHIPGAIHADLERATALKAALPSSMSPRIPSEGESWELR